MQSRSTDPQEMPRVRDFTASTRNQRQSTRDQPSGFSVNVQAVTDAVELETFGLVGLLDVLVVQGKPDLAERHALQALIYLRRFVSDATIQKLEADAMKKLPRPRPVSRRRRKLPATPALRTRTERLAS
jgi:hypothetical protein